MEAADPGLIHSPAPRPEGKGGTCRRGTWPRLRSGWRPPFSSSAALDLNGIAWTKSFTRPHALCERREDPSVPAIRLGKLPGARAKLRTCRGFATTTGSPAAAKATTAGISKPPVVSRTMIPQIRLRRSVTRDPIPSSSFGGVQVSPAGPMPTSSWSLALNDCYGFYTRKPPHRAARSDCR